MVDLRDLERKYRKNHHAHFEDLATLLFCAELKLTRGVNRRFNQVGIEADPVDLNGERIAYQAKYCDSGTKLSKHKSDLLNSVEEAAREKVTRLFIYTNDNLGQINNVDQDKTAPRKKPKYEQETENLAESYGIKIEWISGSNIETMLDEPPYQFIRKIFFEEADNINNYAEFYDFAVDRINSHEANSIYGDIPLKNDYIEPFLEVDAERKNLKAHLTEWVKSRSALPKEKIMVIYGEPGHGKSSLCYKAMYDFKREGWLADVVTNVFCFSLNPADTDANLSTMLNIRDFLKWGYSREHNVAMNACNNALVFLDGFDELLDSVPSLNISGFLQGMVTRFVKSTNAHVVITARRMSIVQELNNRTKCITPNYPAFEIQPVSYEQQIKWILTYIDYCETRAAINENIDNTASELLKEKSIKLKKYLSLYKESSPEESKVVSTARELSSIPLLFRIMVEFQIDPRTFDGSASLYEKLFDLTWERRPKSNLYNNKKHTKESTILALSEHALKCFETGAETAITDIDPDKDNFWTYQFYTKTVDEEYNNSHNFNLRVGFLHRTFYQYFLAKRILLALLEEENQNSDCLKHFLAHLSRFRLDETTLKHIADLYNMQEHEKKHFIHHTLRVAFEILMETDALLIENFNMPWVGTNKNSGEKRISLLEAGNNLFWNIVSTSTLCECFFSYKNDLAPALRIYDLSKVNLENAELSKIDLRMGRLNRAHLRKANLSETVLSRADLRKSILREAVLSKTVLRAADLRGADLQDTDFSGAVLSGADLSDADLRNAVLNSADLVKADLSRADLRAVDFSNADLSGADLRKADLKGVILKGARLIETTFSEGQKSKLLLESTDLSQAKFI